MGDTKKAVERLLRRRNRRTRVYRPGPFAAIYSTLLIVGSAGAYGLYVLLLHVMHGAGAPVGTKLDVAKTALLVVGGSGAVAGLYVSYRKQRTDEANHLRDQDKLFTERYTAAVAQLGNTTSAAVRLGGVYALARIADDSERDRSTCLKVLCAYLRMPHDLDSSDPAERQVRATAQTALAERLRRGHPGFWLSAEIDLSGAHLVNLDLADTVVRSFTATDAFFNGHAKFERAIFEDEAVFDGATFTESAWFQETRFREDAFFFGVKFSESAEFRGATFDADAHFDESTFEWSGNFDNVRFHGHAKFGVTTFSGGTLFRDAIFEKDAWFFGATFHDVTHFERAQFKFIMFEETRFADHVYFDEATFDGDIEFKATTFSRESPPTWPNGFAEPTGIRWAAADPVPDPDSQAPEAS